MPKIVKPNNYRVCSICNIEKSLGEYYLAKTKGSIRAECKDCSSTRRKTYYINNKDIYKLYNIKVISYKI